MTESPRGVVRHRWPKIRCVDREDYVIRSAAQASRVLHVGCADSPLTERRLGQQRLLHLSLAQVTSDLTGVDLDQESLEILRRELPDAQLERRDIEEPWDLRGPPFDLIVCGEVIEHLGSPVRGLRTLASVLASNGTVIVTVPNSTALKAFVRSLGRVEIVHGDHVSSYTPALVAQLASRASLTLQELLQYVAPASSRKSRAVNGVVCAIARLTGAPVGDGLIALLAGRSAGSTG